MTTWSDLWVDKDGNHDARICPCGSCVEIREKAKAAIVSISYVDMVRLHAIAQAAEALVDTYDGNAPVLGDAFGFRLETLRAAVRATTDTEES